MDGTTPQETSPGGLAPGEPPGGPVLQVPLELLRGVARELEAAGDGVEAARSRPAPAYDAGPASAAVARLVDGVDEALTGLAIRLAEASTAFGETAEDLAETDRQQRLRLFEETMGLRYGPG